MKIVAIIQARMASTRLPKKIMLDVGGKPIINWTIDAVKKVELIDEVVLATTDRELDDPLVTVAQNSNIKWFRGSEENVLERFYLAAKENKADVIIRLTSDNPFCDRLMIRLLIEQFMEQKVDYLATKSCKGIPPGLAIEIFSFAALEKSHREAKKIVHREHVTTYIRDHKELFKHGQYSYPLVFNTPDLRLTIDTPDDLKFAREVFKHLKKGFTIEDVLKIIKDNPHLININKHIQPKDDVKKYYNPG